MMITMQNMFAVYKKSMAQKQTHRLRKCTYGCQREETDREFGMAMYTLLYLKWITNKDLLHSTANSVQCYVAAWVGGEFGYMCVYG